MHAIMFKASAKFYGVTKKHFCVHERGVRHFVRRVGLCFAFMHRVIEKFRGKQAKKRGQQDQQTLVVNNDDVRNGE